MNSFKKLSLTFVALLLVTSTVMGQNRPDNGTVGLSASIQNNQTNLQFPIWVGENITVAPVLGISYQENSFTTINMGVAPRFYQNLGHNFASYVGAQGIIQRTSPETGQDDTDILLGATGGGEYFFDERFSMGVEGQLNLFLNENGNNGLSTGTAIVGTYYF